MADPLLSTLRISLLVICMFAAARSDFQTLSVKDAHWKIWALPATVVLLFEMSSSDAGIENVFMTFSIAAVFSLCFVTPPDPRKLGEWGRQDFILSMIYCLGALGLVGGAISYSDTDFIDLALGDESPNTALWWSMVGALLTAVVFYFSWIFGLIPGGADVKALILVILFFPSWAFVPDQIYPLAEDPIFRMPPSLVMFVWAAAAFLIAPPIIFVHNATQGNITSLPDLKMAWHASKKKISEVRQISESNETPSWLLTEIIQKNGESTVVNRILPSSKSTISKEREDDLALLEEMGVNSVWITRKHPFLVYLFLAILPMLLLGDPIAYLIR